jgi:hypothetical protein
MIYHFFDHDTELIYEIIELVMEISIQDLKNLEHHYENKEFFIIKKKFHKSKPMLSYLGAITVKNNIENIEKNIEKKFPYYYNTLLNQLDSLEKELKIFLEKINQ